MDYAREGMKAGNFTQRDALGRENGKEGFAPMTSRRVGGKPLEEAIRLIQSIPV